MPITRLSALLDDLIAGAAQSSRDIVPTDTQAKWHYRTTLLTAHSQCLPRGAAFSNDTWPMNQHAAAVWRPKRIHFRATKSITADIPACA
jgi:hypothetical protein